jgi:hypothetical protein
MMIATLTTLFAHSHSFLYRFGFQWRSTWRALTGSWNHRPADPLIPARQLFFLLKEYRAQLSQPITNPIAIITNKRIARGMVTVANKSLVSTLAVFWIATIKTRIASTAITPSLILWPKSFIDVTFDIKV